MTVKGLKTQTLQTADNVSGLVLLNTTSFSGVASQSINDVFSATYTNYLINAEIIADTSRTLTFRYRVAGADNSTSIYQSQTMNAFSTTVGGARVNNASSGSFGYVDQNGRAGFTCFVFNPFASQRSTYRMASNLLSSTGVENYTVTNSYDATTSFTGFTILSSGGTGLTGSISVYGLAK
jgi:hypothetical protein